MKKSDTTICYLYKPILNKEDILLKVIGYNKIIIDTIQGMMEKLN